MHRSQTTPLLLRNINLEIRRKQLRKILVAVSGGADSICLLHLMSSVKNLGIVALHCNFHLRGEESNRDCEHVKSICKELGIALETIDFDVNSRRLSHPEESTEMACRNLRYDWFFDRLEELRADRIATGHNADDNIETFFLNMLRGSGTRGLKGMQEDNGKIWRPLIHTHRKDILDYLKDQNVHYINDSTNFESEYQRNFLRNEIIPLLKERWPGFDKALDKTIYNISEENKIIEESISDKIIKNKKFLPTSEILNYPAPELLIRRFITEAGPFTTTSYEILAAIKADKPHIRTWQLKAGKIYLRNHLLFKELFI